MDVYAARNLCSRSRRRFERTTLKCKPSKGNRCRLSRPLAPRRFDVDGMVAALSGGRSPRGEGLVSTARCLRRPWQRNGFPVFAERRSAARSTEGTCRLGAFGVPLCGSPDGRRRSVLGPGSGLMLGSSPHGGSAAPRRDGGPVTVDAAALGPAWRAEGGSAAASPNRLSHAGAVSSHPLLSGRA